MYLILDLIVPIFASTFNFSIYGKGNFDFNMIITFEVSNNIEIVDESEGIFEVNYETNLNLLMKKADENEFSEVATINLSNVQQNPNQQLLQLEEITNLNLYNLSSVFTDFYFTNDKNNYDESDTNYFSFDFSMNIDSIYDFKFPGNVEKSASWDRELPQFKYNFADNLIYKGDLLYIGNQRISKLKFWPLVDASDGYGPLITYAQDMPFSQDEIDNLVPDDTAYKTGYNEGYNTGLQNGIAQGEQNAQFNISGIVQSIFSGINNFFSIEIFPNIKLWYIIGIPLILSIVFFIIGWFKG